MWPKTSLPMAAFCCALCLALGPAHAEAPEIRNADVLSLSPCRLSSPGLARHITARCGTIEVPEDWSAQGGRRISLDVAVLETTGRKPEPDPLFFFAGGPGQAATESVVAVAAGFKPSRRTRDIVLMNQRGTGEGRKLWCRNLKRGSSLAGILDASDSEHLRACVADLEADPSVYTTEAAVRDFDLVREALGYETINIYGVSYGTRVALTYLKRFGSRVRAVILDGVLPQDEALGAEVSTDAQRAMDQILQRCALNESCNTRFPDLAAKLEALVERLETDSPEVETFHPRTGEPIKHRYSRIAFAQTLRMLSYATETSALIPLLIHTTHESGDFSRMLRQTIIIGSDLENMLSMELNLSVMCAEDIPFLPKLQSAATRESYLGDIFGEEALEACGIWPHATVPASFKEPVRAETPVLLLSGELDPVTPPSNAEKVAESLPNSVQIVVPGQGHGVIVRGCVPKLVDQFLRNPDPGALDTECVEDIKPQPFFIDFSGQEP